MNPLAGFSVPPAPNPRAAGFAGAAAGFCPNGVGALADIGGIAALAGWFFNLDKIAFGVLVLQVATPVAVTSYLLAEKYGADAQSVAGLVVVSTVLSVAALPLMLGFLL